MPKDFSHQDLRGRSFKGQDLTGANFSHADIRGVSFKGAILKGANFANAEGGITKKSFVVYSIMILILSTPTGFLLGYFNGWIVLLVVRIINTSEAITGYEIIISTLLFSIVYIQVSVYLIRKGTYSLWSISLIPGVAVVVFVAVAILVVGVVTLNGINDAATVTSAAALSIFVAIGTVAIAIAITVAVSVSVSISIVAVAVPIAVAGVVIVVVIGSLFGAGVGAMGGAALVPVITITIAWFTVIQLIVFCYIAYRTSKEDTQFETYRRFGIFLSSLFGTNFDGANLKDADFSKTSLKYCRFSKETIILRTCFKNSENLKFARLTGTIMENKAVRELLVTGNGKNQSFRELNLKGAYLVGADLSGADFHEADFIGATLENANLRDSNLSRIQALGVEFRGADFHRRMSGIMEY